VRNLPNTFKEPLNISTLELKHPENVIKNSLIITKSDKKVMLRDINTGFSVVNLKKSPDLTKSVDKPKVRFQGLPSWNSEDNAKTENKTPFPTNGGLNELQRIREIERQNQAMAQSNQKDQKHPYKTPGSSLLESLRNSEKQRQNSSGTTSGLLGQFANLRNVGKPKTAPRYGGDKMNLSITTETNNDNVTSFKDVFRGATNIEEPQRCDILIHSGNKNDSEISFGQNNIKIPDL